jgi:hypothetical protein
MKNEEAKTANHVTAATSGHGRLKKGKTYYVHYQSTDDTKYLFVLDETNNINGYHIRNFQSKLSKIEVG